MCICIISKTHSLCHTVALATVAFCLAAKSAAAQRGDVHGRVVAAPAGAPVVGATVDLVRGTDTAAVGRAVTAADGTFRVERVAAGRYRARVRRMGFAPKTTPQFAVTAAAPSVDVGTITLNGAPVELSAVTSTAQKHEVSLEPDRNTFVVRDLPTVRGGSAIDVLRTVPSVDVDIDNIVTLRGDAGVIVQINGRKSPMKPAQLGNFLAQLPASMVEKVEVISNPSARDNPEGTAGIINIVLKRDADAGASGGLTLAGATTGRVDVGGNAGYQRGPLTLFGSYGFSRDNRPRNDLIFRENLYATPLTFLDETSARSQIPLSHTLTGSLAYKANQHDELGADLLFSTRDDAVTSDILYRNLDATRRLTSTMDRSSDGTHHEGSFESTVDYRHTFAQKDHKLAAELQLTRDYEGGPNAYVTSTLTAAGTPAADPAGETSTGWEHPLEGSFKTDYNRPLGSGLRLGAGYKGTFQRFHTTLDTRVLDAASSAFVPDPTRTSDFNYDTGVNAGYGMLTAQAGKLQMQGGVRVEHAATRFHLNGVSGDVQSTYDNSYNSVFPSALVAYRPDDVHQVKLSYSTRIRRPDDTDLIDPTLHFQDPLNLSRGNAYLRPEYTRALELGLQRETDLLTLQLTPFYRYTRDAVRRIRTVDANGVTTTTFANVATTNSYGGDATVALHQGRLTGFAGASAFRQVSDAANLGPGYSARAFGWSARSNAALRVTRTFDLQALVTYRAAQTVEQGRNLSQTRVNLAARRKLMDDRMNLTLRVLDPFGTERERSITTDPRFYQTTDRARKVRGLLLNVTWNFGASNKLRQEDEPLVSAP